MEKLHASSNSERHCLLAKCVLLDLEDPETFSLHHQQDIDRINPSDGIEITLVEDLAATTWRQRRLWRIEKNLLSEAMQKRPETTGNWLAGAFSGLSRGPELTLIDRQEPRLHRSFHRTLKNIQLLRQIELPNEPKSSGPITKQATYPQTSATATGVTDFSIKGGADLSLLPAEPAVPFQHAPAFPPAPTHPKIIEFPNEPRSAQPPVESTASPTTSNADSGAAKGGAGFSLLPAEPTVPFQHAPPVPFQQSPAVPLPANPKIIEFPNEPRFAQPPVKSIAFPTTFNPHTPATARLTKIASPAG